MTEEQIQYLKDNNIAYSPSLFKYMQWKYPDQPAESHFKRYLSYLRLRAYRNYGWVDSEHLEEWAKDWFERITNND